MMRLASLNNKEVKRTATNAAETTDGKEAIMQYGTTDVMPVQYGGTDVPPWQCSYGDHLRGEDSSA